MTANSILYIVFAIIAAVNLAVSIAVARSHYYERTQVVLQVLLVWVLPVVGAVIIAMVLRSQNGGARAYTESFPDRNEPGADVGSSDHHGF